MYFYFNAK